MGKNNQIFMLILTALTTLQCSIGKHIPYCSINDVSFLISPHIVQKDEEYLLEYQIAAQKDKVEQRLQVGSFIRNEKVYYYFIGKTSYRELGNVVLRPLSQDNVTNFAIEGSIYWLNADKSEVKLKIIH